MVEQEKTPLRNTRIFGFLLVAVAFGLIILSFSLAVPEGADFSFISSGTAPNATAENRTDAGGTISILTFDVLSQDQKWKGYVGNITGKFALRDANLYVLYDWEFVGTALTGQIFATRTNTPDWTTVICANETAITADEDYFGIAASSIDSVRNTFGYNAHDAFVVGTPSGGSNAIGESTCNSTATYINSTAQNLGAPVADIYFQEILLQEGNGYVVYTTLIEDNYDAYTDTVNETFDFQMIVPESPINASSTYYFYTEIDS